MKHRIFLFIMLAISLCACQEKKCPQGYVGEDCDVPANEKYNGTYTITENCSVSGSSSNVIYLAPDGNDPLKFIVTGTFWDEAGIELTININPDNTFSFSAPSQPLAASGFNVEMNSGLLESNGDISGTYTIFNGSVVVETCTFTGF